MTQTPEKTRHLNRAATATGQFCILAIDHRANLRDELARHRPTPFSDEAMLTFKLMLIKTLLPPVSALLTDPPTLAAIQQQRLIQQPLGLLAPLEITDYSQHPSRRDTRFIPNWGVGHIKGAGGDGAKLLLYYNPQDSKAARKRQLVADIVAQCAQHELPLYLEPIPYALQPDEALTPDQHRDMVIESAATFAQMGVDILKLPYPLPNPAPEQAHRAALRALDEACGHVPWTLLSAGVDYETFRQQARRAVAHGASGVIVGRAIWGEATALPSAEQAMFFQHTALPRLEELAAICRNARDWRSR